MPQIVLDEPGVGALVGQRKAAGVPEHVGMGRQGQPRQFPIAAQQRPEGLARQRRPPGTQKQRMAIQGCPGAAFFLAPLLQPALPFGHPAFEQPDFFRPQRRVVVDSPPLRRCT